MDLIQWSSLLQVFQNWLYNYVGLDNIQNTLVEMITSIGSYNRTCISDEVWSTESVAIDHAQKQLIIANRLPVIFLGHVSQALNSTSPMVLWWWRCDSTELTSERCIDLMNSCSSLLLCLDGIQLNNWIISWMVSLNRTLLEKNCAW